MNGRHWLSRVAMMAGLALLVGGGAVTPVAASDNPHPGPPRQPVPIESSQDLSRVSSTPSAGSVNTDIAFWGTTAYMGFYGGVQIMDLANPTQPRVVSVTRCGGSQADVSVLDGLLFMSVDRPQTKPGCDSVNTVDNAPGWEGIRVFDVRDPASPRYVTSVATDCGSHTHTLVPDVEHGRALLYVTSYSNNSATFGPTEWGNDCQLDHGYISVVEVPLANPAAARVASEPRLPLDQYFHNGGNGCHDIGVFTGLQLAAAACVGNALLLDLSDPVNPRATDVVGLPHAKAFWHSGAFSPDGRVAVFGDETYGGSGNACRNKDVEGRMWFFRVDPDTKRFTGREPVGSFKIPRQQDGGVYASCTAHNYNVLPIPGKYLLNSAWYAGGTTMVDFSDPANPREVAHLDYANPKFYSGAWSSYYYNGYTYVTSMSTGFEVLDYTGTEDAGVLPQPHLNPQTQEQPLPGVSGAAAVSTPGPSAALWEPTPAGPQPWRTGCCCCAAAGC